MTGRGVGVPIPDQANPGHMIIYAESGVQIGTGHIMRCLALAQAWRRAEGTAEFMIPEASLGITQRIRAAGFQVGMLEPSGKDGVVIGQGKACQLAVLDGYSFGRTEQDIFGRNGVPVLFLDDYGHAESYSARWVLNQNSYARPEMYSRRNGTTELLLGPEYALLREEFLPWMGWKRTIPERATKILVTMGGSDAENASARILKCLSDLNQPALDVVLVVGASNPHWPALRRSIEQSQLRVRAVQNALDMPAQMAWADLTIAAAGGTSYELCYMGLPSILIVAAENQRRVAESLAELGIATNAGPGGELDLDRLAKQLSDLLESSSRREQMSQKGRALVDGMGAERVRASALGRGLWLRPLEEKDCELLFGWANDAVTRSASFQPRQISWAEHTKWFAQKLHDPNSLFYVGQNVDGVAVGHVRFELESERAVLSINVAPEHRGKGWGRELIGFSVRSLIRNHPVTRVDALVKPGNYASVRLFQKSGFRQIGTKTIAGQPALIFSWECKTDAN